MKVVFNISVDLFMRHTRHLNHPDWIRYIPINIDEEKLPNQTSYCIPQIKIHQKWKLYNDTEQNNSTSCLDQRSTNDGTGYYTRDPIRIRPTVKTSCVHVMKDWKGKIYKFDKSIEINFKKINESEIRW